MGSVHLLRTCLVHSALAARHSPLPLATRHSPLHMVGNGIATRVHGNRALAVPSEFRANTRMNLTVPACALLASTLIAMSADLNTVFSCHPNARHSSPADSSQLPLGAVKPAGWLKDQLTLQANGLTGISMSSGLGADSAWKGKDGDGWERGPYYLDGLVLWLPVDHAA